MSLQAMHKFAEVAEQFCGWAEGIAASKRIRYGFQDSSRQPWQNQ